MRNKKKQEAEHGKLTMRSAEKVFEERFSRHHWLLMNVTNLETENELPSERLLWIPDLKLKAWDISPIRPDCDIPGVAAVTATRESSWERKRLQETEKGGVGGGTSPNWMGEEVGGGDIRGWYPIQIDSKTRDHGGTNTKRWSRYCFLFCLYFIYLHTKANVLSRRRSQLVERASTYTKCQSKRQRNLWRENSTAVKWPNWVSMDSCDEDTREVWRGCRTW